MFYQEASRTQKDTTMTTLTTFSRFSIGEWIATMPIVHAELGLITVTIEQYIEGYTFTQKRDDGKEYTNYRLYKTAAGAVKASAKN